jgi:hypothetical protein
MTFKARETVAPARPTESEGDLQTRDAILQTVALPHYFASAFDREQVFRYLQVRLSREDFAAALQDLVRAGLLSEKRGCLYAREVDGDGESRQAWSRDLFRRHAQRLRTLSRFPWVRFMGLTGANAFESCRQEDDLDLFVVTAPERLWLTFLAMIVFSRSVGLRDLFCINYLVDEDHLRISHESYYTAVQLMSMVPLVDRGVSVRLLRENRWVFEYLPNASPALESNPLYALEPARDEVEPASRRGYVVPAANRLMYRVYARRLRQKYPEAFGKGIVVSEAVARLHRVDYGDLYEKIIAEGGSCAS